MLRFRWMTLLVGFAGAGLALHYAVGNLGINTDTADMIDASLPWRKHFIEYRERFTLRDRNIVVVVDARSARQADALASALAAELRRQPQLYRSVFLAGDGEFFERNGLLYLPLEELEALTDRLATAQPLLGRLARRFDGAGLLDVVAESTAAQADGLHLASPDELYAELARTLDAARSDERRPLSWQRLISGGAGADGARRLVLVQPVQDFTKVQPAAHAIREIRERADRLQAEHALDGAVVRLTGTVALEHEELVSVSRGAALGGVLAMLMVAAVLYWALRSVTLVAVSLLTLVAGLAGTAAFAAAAVGHLNLLSVAFAMLYIGLGIDFAIHLCLRLKELLAAGVHREPAIVESARGVGRSLVICTVTTAAGFYAFIPTPFRGVAELGLISGTGMFVSLLVSLTLLPALLAVLPQRRRWQSRAPWLGARLVAPLVRRPRFVLAAAALVGAGTVAALPRAGFDSNPVLLRDPASESVRTLEELAAAGDAAQLQLVAVARDPDTARTWAAALEALPTVREVRTLDSLVPADQQEKLWLLEDIELVLGPGFARLERLPPDPQALHAALRRLAATFAEQRHNGSGAPVLTLTTELLLAELDALPPPERRRLLIALEQDLLDDLPWQLARLDRSLGAQPFGADALPLELAARWRGAGGEELIEIVPAENVMDEAAARRFVESVRSVVPQATGLPVVYQEASGTVVRSFQLAFLYAFLMVLAILLLLLRSVRESLLIIVPILLAGAVTAGLTVPFGITFNFANIIALPLLMGIGVDSAIHIVHRMRHEPPADGEFYGTSTSRAVFASGLTTVATFGNLGFAAHQGMASMGKLLALGMGVTLATTLILLPALLHLRARTEEVRG